MEPYGPLFVSASKFNLPVFNKKKMKTHAVINQANIESEKKTPLFVAAYHESEIFLMNPN